MTPFLLLFWRQIAGAICSEFVHIQSFAAYHLRLRSLPLTLRYMDKFSQLLPQLPSIARERWLHQLFPHHSRSAGSPCASYARFSPVSNGPGGYRRQIPTDLRSLWPLACATHTFRPFPTAFQATAFALALLRRAPTFQVSTFHRFNFSLRRTAVPPPSIIPSIQPTRVNAQHLDPAEAGPSVSPCCSLQV